MILDRPSANGFARLVARFLIAVLLFGLVPSQAYASLHAPPVFLPALSLAESVPHALLAVVAVVGQGTTVPSAVVLLLVDPHLPGKYHRARWMDPRSGRFAGMDRFAGRRQQPLTLHKYLYAGAAPVDKVDPTGEFEALATLSLSLGMMSTLNAFASIGLGDPGEDEEPKLPKPALR